MLGAEQSGNMSAVGFDLFAQMLNQAVNETREGTGASGELPPALSDITVNIPGHAYLPEEYIPDADARVLWYRKLASAATVEEVAALREDMLAKAPEMPEAAANLFERAWLKAFANEHGVKLISVAAGKLIVEPIDIPAAAMKPLRRAAGRYQADRRQAPRCRCATSRRRSARTCFRPSCTSWRSCSARMMPKRRLLSRR